MSSGECIELDLVSCSGVERAADATFISVDMKD